MPTPRPSTQGFTLVELSIVIVIIGLLAGGILVGRNLLKAQLVRNTATQAAAYNAAFQQFKQKYGYKPGDFPTATQVWGASGLVFTDAAGNTQCSALPTTTNATCNGNGDGHVNTNGIQNETNLLWQHLSLAGMIDGRFMGKGGPAGANTVVAGYNGPAGPYPKSVWAFAPYGSWAWSAYFFPSVTDHEFFYLGGNMDTSDKPPVDWGSVKPGDLFVLDTKIDDGRPDRGKVQGYNMSNAAIMTSPACVNMYAGPVLPAYELVDQGLSLSTAGLMGCVAVFVPDGSATDR